jgi:hypothetical protein
LVGVGSWTPNHFHAKMSFDAMEQATQELDWVTVRAECTIRSVFKRLCDETKIDVSTRNKYLSESQKNNGMSFSVEEKDEESFVVYRNGSGITSSVSFAIFGTCIKAIGGGTVTIEATMGMNDSGRCMLRMKGAEIENWQFRRKAMESLFFPDVSVLI